MQPPRLFLLSLAAALTVTFAAGDARAHCDALDGPVVRDARLALDRGDPTPVLKWVAPDGEAEVREAFRAALAVRAKGGEAKQLADRYFFETLVRVHRAGEGEGFTGLKPAGSVDPGIAAADRAFEAGSAKSLSQKVSARLADGVTARFRHAMELKQHAGDSAEAGRAYVAAYVDYIKFVEEADRLARLGAPHVHHDEPAH
jgi:hypothetical protein